MFEQAFLGQVRLAAQALGQGHTEQENAPFSKYVWHCASQYGHSATLYSESTADMLVSRGWSCYKKENPNSVMKVYGQKGSVFGAKLPPPPPPPIQYPWEAGQFTPTPPPRRTPPPPTPTPSRRPTNVPQYSWNNQAQNQDVASVQCPPGQRWDGIRCVLDRPGIPTLPFGSLFNQSMTAAPLTAASATSYGNYAGT